MAVLTSGGIESAVLIGTSLAAQRTVYPLYLRAGLAWEAAELPALEAFLKAVARPNLQPLTVLDVPVADLYDGHWSLTGDAPDAAAPDEDFYLPGRNVLLLSKALVWCRMRRIAELAIGSLGTNPFPDATAEFFAEFAAVVGRAVGGNLRVTAPFSGMTKEAVLERGRDLPLQFTLSCMSPAGGLHCGRCGKCFERGKAFAAAGLTDPTTYASDAWNGATQRRAERRPWLD